MHNTGCAATAVKEVRKTDFLLRAFETKRAQRRPRPFVTSVVLGLVCLVNTNQASISSQINEYVFVFL